VDGRKQKAQSSTVQKDQAGLYNRTRVGSRVQVEVPGWAVRKDQDGEQTIKGPGWLYRMSRVGRMLKDQARLDKRNKMGVESRRTMLSWYRRTGVGDVVQKDQTRQCRSIRVGSRMYSKGTWLDCAERPACCTEEPGWIVKYSTGWAI
jgi:hypothetical protein